MDTLHIALIASFFGTISSLAVWYYQQHLQSRNTRKALLKIFAELIKRDLDVLTNTNSLVMGNYLNTSLWRYHHLKLVEVAPDIAPYIDSYYLDVEEQLASFTSSYQNNFGKGGIDYHALIASARRVLSLMPPV